MTGDVDKAAQEIESRHFRKQLGDAEALVTDDMDAKVEHVGSFAKAKPKLSGLAYGAYEGGEQVMRDAFAPIIADGGGLRKNAGKNRLDLLPIEWAWALGDVMTQGSIKYAARNWERGMAWSIMVGCTMRHLLKFMAGERYDDETGCHHLAMAAWNCLALMSYDLRGIGENDLASPGIDILSKVHCRKD